MFKLVFLLLIATISLFPHQSDAECCGTSFVMFLAKEKECADFGARKGFFSGRCEMTICGDGEKLKEGLYCGRGPCNILGCNCDGGCIRGNAVENFKSIHGDAIHKVFRLIPPQ